jgi:hypothetical protein
VRAWLAVSVIRMNTIRARPLLKSVIPVIANIHNLIKCLLFNLVETLLVTDHIRLVVNDLIPTVLHSQFLSHTADLISNQGETSLLFVFNPDHGIK